MIVIVNIDAFQTLETFVVIDISYCIDGVVLASHLTKPARGSAIASS